MCLSPKLSIYNRLPEDIQHVVERHRYNKVVTELEHEFRSWRHFALMDELDNHISDWSLWEDPTMRLMVLVNADKHCIQPGHTDFEKYLDDHQILLRQYEDDDYEFGMSCNECIRDGSFPCQGCSTGPLRGWVDDGCFDFHNFKGWPVDED